MSTLSQAILCGALTGLLGLLARRWPALGWIALTPLGIAARLHSVFDTAVAAALAGMIVGAAPLWRRFSPALLTFACVVHAAAWGAAWGMAADLWSGEALAIGILILPPLSVLALMPLRVLGAPRWISNPLATTQERWLSVVHTARIARVGDLFVALQLSTASCCFAVLLLQPGVSLSAGLTVFVTAMLLALVLRFGHHSARTTRDALDRSPRLRVAAIAADAAPSTDEAGSRRDVAAALLRYDPLVQSARREGARLIVLPEIAVTIGPTTRELWFEALSSWAAGLEVVIVAGHFDEFAQQNLLVVVDADGRLLGDYEKQHPGPHEPKRHQRMTPLVARPRHADMPLISTVICADLDYDDLHKTVRQQGGLLAVPANDWPAIAELHHRAAVWAAVLGGVSVIRATGHGLSSLYDAAGRVVASASNQDRHVVLVADLPITARLTTKLKL